MQLINQSIYKSDLTDCYKEKEREIPQKKLLICHKTEGRCHEYSDMRTIWAVRVKKKRFDEKSVRITLQQCCFGRELCSCVGEGC